MTSPSAINATAEGKTKNVHFCYNNSPVLLATALVNVCDINGDPQLCRVFLDQGSEMSCISENCMKRLGLARTKTNINLAGLCSSSVGTAKGVAKLKISSLIQDFSFTVNALILNKLTGTIPNENYDISNWKHIQNIPCHHILIFTSQQKNKQIDI